MNEERRLTRDECERFCRDRRNPSHGLTVDQWVSKEWNEPRWQISYWVWVSKTVKERVITPVAQQLEEAVFHAIFIENSFRQKHSLPLVEP